MKLLNVVVIILCAVPVFAQGAKDTAGEPAYKYSLTLQVGPPVSLRHAEPFEEFIYFNGMRGTRKGYGFASGLTFRYYTDESFYLHFRVMYSSRNFSSYDSTVNTADAYDEIQATYTDHHLISYAVTNNYTINNILFGLGGGHEGRYGRFIVRAGAELGFLKYLKLETYASSGVYDDVTTDSLSGGTGHSLELRGWVDHTKYPLCAAIGLSGHATLEYLVKPNFGIGATIYLGGFVMLAKNVTKTEEAGNNNSYTDSNGNNTIDRETTITEWKYTSHAFDFSPLNGQINLVYYFGK